MNQFFERIGNAVTSMSAIIFVLMMVIASGTFFSHTLFYEIFPSEMTEWEKSIATWTLACAWELTVLLTTVNTTHLSKLIPYAMAICSGLIILMFLHGFDSDLSWLEYFKRWFIGTLVANISIVFSGLFYSKWCEAKKQKSLEEKLSDLEWTVNHQHTQLSDAKCELEQSKKDFDQLFTYTEELEAFKAAELKKLECPHCRQQFETIYKLTSHKGTCSQNPNKGQKSSVFDDLSSNRIQMIK